jgi:hypothetical protein
MTHGMLFRLYAILALAISSAGCELIEGVFKAGMWVGIILVVLVVGGIMLLVGRLRR